MEMGKTYLPFIVSRTKRGNWANCGKMTNLCGETEGGKNYSTGVWLCRSLSVSFLVREGKVAACCLG